MNLGQALVLSEIFLCRCMSDVSLPNCMFSFGLSEDDRTRLCEASACLIISLRESGGFDFVVFIFFFSETYYHSLYSMV